MFVPAALWALSAMGRDYVAALARTRTVAVFICAVECVRLLAAKRLLEQPEWRDWTFARYTLRSRYPYEETFSMPVQFTVADARRLRDALAAEARCRCSTRRP